MMLFGKPLVRPLSGISQMSCVSSVAEQAKATQLLSAWLLGLVRLFVCGGFRNLGVTLLGPL